MTGYDPSLAKGQGVRVNVRYRKGSRRILESSFDLTVVREDGSKVWLGDGSGKGLIIKK